jgi:2-aminoethylphosphonate dioxygenase
MARCPLPISHECVVSFRTQGYVCLRGLLSPEVACELREISDQMSEQALAIVEFCRAARTSLADRAKVQPMELIVVPEASSPTQVCRYEFMLGSNLRFKEFVSRFVQPVVAELVGEAVVPFKDKTNEKLPGGGGFPPHQDFAAYRGFKPRYHATILLTIHAANIDNGCVQFAGNCEDVITHRSGFIRESIEGRPLLQFYEGGPRNGDIRSDISAQLRWHPLHTSPEDIVVFDSLVPHYSGANNSNVPRRAIFVTFNRASEGMYYEEYYADKRANYDDPKFHVSTPTSHRETGSTASDDRPPFRLRHSSASAMPDT